MIFTRLEIDSKNQNAWPFTIPSVAQILGEGGLDFTAPLTVLVGANGSGKSTLLEAIAECYGLDVRGGHGDRQYGSAHTHKSPLADAMRLLSGGLPLTSRKRPGFFLRAETAAGMLAFMSERSIRGYGNDASYLVSHGESYLNVIEGRFQGQGLFLLDEAEGPLSFESTLQLALTLQDLAKRPNTQIIYATHSPLIPAIPDAAILELDETGIDPVEEWNDLKMVALWKRFLADPSFYFRIHD
jgi:predicted ATPase